jgi:hypothetical protein
MTSMLTLLVAEVMTATRASMSTLRGQDEVVEEEEEEEEEEGEEEANYGCC